MCRRTPADAARDARLCDPANMQTTPPARPDLLPDDHREHTSTAVRSWSCHCPEPALARACRRRAACSQSAHSGAALPPAAPATARFRPPSPPRLSAPTLRRDARKSPTGDRAASDHVFASQHVLQHFGYIFAQLAQLATTITLHLLGRVRLGFARQMLGQRTPHRFRSRTSNKDARLSRLTLDGTGRLALRSEFFQPQLQLFDLPLQLL